MYILKCRLCGISFSYGRKGKLYCSGECSRRHRRLKVRRCDFVGPLMVDRSGNPVARECAHCGDIFTPHMPRARFCSKACGDASYLSSGRKRKHKARRRELAKDGETFDPYEIFWRDRWRCRSCKHSAPEKLRGTLHNRAPQLDHIIPLSMGGKHTRRNTQLLCRECNQKKGSGTLYDQTLLFG